MKVHTNNILKSTLVATIGALVAASPSLSATLTNGNFEAFVPGNVNGTPEIGLNGQGLSGFLPDSTAIPGWTVISGNQATPITGGALYQGNNRFANNGVLSRTVQLNRQFLQGGISTLITDLIPNAINRVTVFFDLSGNPGNQPLVSVSLAGAGNAQFFGLISNGGFPTILGTSGANPTLLDLLFETKTATFLLTTGAQQTSSVLSFTSQSGNGLGPIIDNVSLTPIPFEFSPLTGFIAGGVLFGSYKLIKRKKSVA